MTNTEGAPGGGTATEGEQLALAASVGDLGERLNATASLADPATAFDLRCSTACTASGASILLLCAVTLATLAVVAKEVHARALTEYLQRRSDLTEAMRQLQADDCWATIGGNDSWPIKKLSRLRCTGLPPRAGPTQESTPPSRETSPATTDAAQRPPSAPIQTPLAPPREVRLSIPFTNATKVRDGVAALVDAKLLTTARGYSNRADKLIFDWESLRYDLLKASSVGAVTSQVEAASSPVAVVVVADGELTVDHALENLTVGAVRKLADYELPSSTEIDSMLQGRGMQVPSIGTLPVGFGVIALEGLLLIAMMHFWLYFREATLSPSFPPGATLFGVLWRTRGSFVIFIALSIAPALCGVLLAAMAGSITRAPIMLCVPLLFMSAAVAKRAGDARLKRTQ